MDTTRPGDIPELDAQGWPALVRNLRVSDERGRPVPITPAGESGWRLDPARTGRLSVRYEVDYSALASRRWPAPRESAFADADDFVIAGRSLFITTPESGSSRVTFPAHLGEAPAPIRERPRPIRAPFQEETE